MFFLCFLLLSRYIEKRKLGFSSSLYAWNHFPLIAPKGNILLIDVTLPFFQLPYQPAFRHPAMALQSENAHIIAQNAQKQLSQLHYYPNQRSVCPVKQIIIRD